MRVTHGDIVSVSNGDVQLVDVAHTVMFKAEPVIRVRWNRFTDQRPSSPDRCRGPGTLETTRFTMVFRAPCRAIRWNNGWRSGAGSCP